MEGEGEGILMWGGKRLFLEDLGGLVGDSVSMWDLNDSSADFRVSMLFWYSEMCPEMFES